MSGYFSLRNMGSAPRFAIIFIFVILNTSFTTGINAWAKEVPFTQEDRDRLIRIETKIEEIDKRFEQIDKRFEQIDKRFDDVNKRFGDMMSFMWILASVFGGLVAVTIGFAVWDRRTMIRPFESKVKEIEEGKIERIISALRGIADDDPKVAEILKRLNLL